MIPSDAGARIREAREKRGWYNADLAMEIEEKTGELNLLRAVLGYEDPYRPPTETEWRAICALMPEVLDGAIAESDSEVLEDKKS